MFRLKYFVFQRREAGDETQVESDFQSVLMMILNFSEKHLTS